MPDHIRVPCRSVSVTRNTFWDHVAQCAHCQRHGTMETENWRTAMRDFTMLRVTTLRVPWPKNQPEEKPEC